MKKYLNWLGGAVVLAFMLTSCVSTAHIEKDDNADFSHYKTFAWADKPGDIHLPNGEVKKDRNRNNDLLEAKIRQAVNKELESSAGWKEVKTNPDILLNYDVLVERSIKEQNDPVYSRPWSRLVYNPYSRRYATIYYPSQFLGYDYDQRMVREGTVTITMIDTNTDKTVWQGWSTDEVNNRNMSAKEIQSSVKAIFRKFDVAKN